MQRTTFTLVLFLLARIALAQPFNAKIRIINIDVGQGDATLIMVNNDDGNMKSILFDAGKEKQEIDGGAVIANVLKDYGIKIIDYYITSHYDDDHIGGAYSGKNRTSFIQGSDKVAGTNDDVEILNWIDRGEYQLDQPTLPYKKWVKLRDSLERFSNTPPNIIHLTTQSKINNYKIDLGDNVSFICLAGNGMVRSKGRAEVNILTENAMSLCFMLKWGDFEYVVGGDLIGRKTRNTEDAKVEDLVGDYLKEKNISVDILHANHHGADNASSETYLENIKPSVIIISNGQVESYRHPNINALVRLSNSTATDIYQTNPGTTQWNAGGITSTMRSLIRSKQKISEGDIIIDVDSDGYKIFGGNLQSKSYSFN